MVIGDDSKGEPGKDVPDNDEESKEKFDDWLDELRFRRRKSMRNPARGPKSTRQVSISVGDRLQFLAERHCRRYKLRPVSNLKSLNWTPAVLHAFLKLELRQNEEDSAEQGMLREILDILRRQEAGERR